MKKLLFLIYILFKSSILISLAQPALQWANSFGSTGEDRGRKVISDKDGNILIAGYFSGTVDFDPSDTGNYSLTEKGGRDAYVLKLDAKGRFLWVKRIGGNATDIITDIVLDKAQNIYITGLFQSTSDFDPSDTGVYELTPVGGLDAFAAKYDTDGNLIWAHGFGSTTFENGNSIAIDPWGNAIFCGYFTGTVDFDPNPTSVYYLTSAGANEIFVCKLNSNGNFIWAKRIGGTGTDMANGLVCDDAGNIYMTGVFSGSVDFDPGSSVAVLTSAGVEDVFVTKLDSAGNYVWAKKFGASKADYGNDIGLDSSNNVYTTGYFDGTVDFNPGIGSGEVFNISSNGGKDVFVSKLDKDGKFLWAKTIGGKADDGGYGMSIKPEGDLICSGYFSGNVDFNPGADSFYVETTTGSNSNDAYALKLDANGNFVFALGVGSSGLDLGYDVLEDSSGSFYLIGFFAGSPDFDPKDSVYSLTSAGSLDMFIAKYFYCMGSTSDTIALTTCQSYTLNGQTYTSSGLYMQTLVNSLGCDSLLYLDLTIKNSTSDTQTIKACDSFTLNGQTYTKSGLYLQQLTNANGCDSLLYLQLTIYAMSDSIFPTVCKSYTLNGQTYTSSGTYSQLLKNTNGCDSLLYIILTIKTVDVSTTLLSSSLIANSNVGSYQWIDCNKGNAIIPGETKQAFTPKYNGNFAVIVTANGCSDTSECVSVFTIGINEVDALAMTVKPNPFHSETSISFNHVQQNTTVIITDLLGNEIKKMLLNGQQLVLDSAGMKAGIYFLQATNQAQETCYMKIIIN